MSTVIARFIGRDSCGFIHGRIYHLKIFTNGYDEYLWVKSKYGKGLCPYSSIKTLAKNWEIPVRSVGLCTPMK